MSEDVQTVGDGKFPPRVLKPKDWDAWTDEHNPYPKDSIPGFFWVISFLDDQRVAINDPKRSWSAWAFQRVVLPLLAVSILFQLGMLIATVVK